MDSLDCGDDVGVDDVDGYDVDGYVYGYDVGVDGYDDMSKSLVLENLYVNRLYVPLLYLRNHLQSFKWEINVY